MGFETGVRRIWRHILSVVANRKSLRPQQASPTKPSVFSQIKRILADGLTIKDSPVLSLRASALYASAFAIVTMCVMLSYNQFFSSTMGDHLFWQAISDYHPLFGNWYSAQNSDPLQGMFDLFPQGYRGNLIFDTLFSLPIPPHISDVVRHGFIAILSAGSTFFLARSAGLPNGVATIAGILFSISTMPFLLSNSGVVTHIYALTINYAYVQSTVLLALALFWTVDRTIGVKFLASAFAGFLLLADSANAMALHITLFVPAALVFGIGGLIAADNRSELRARLLWAVLVTSALLALGIPNYIYAMGSDLAYKFFFAELNDFSQPWTPQFQHFLDDFYYVISWRGNPKGLVAAIASTLGLASAIYYSVLGGIGKFRIFARCFLVLVLLTSVAVFVLHFPVAFFGKFYQGPNAYHLIYVFWSFHAIFIARALHDIMFFVCRQLRRQRIPSLERRLIHGLVGILIIVPLVQLKPLLQQPGLEVSAGRFDLSIRHNPITKFLSDNIGVAPGAIFGGSYNNFAGYDKTRENRTNLVQDHYYAGFQLTLRTGSDLTKHGLWMLGIPTLSQESVTITAQLYYMVKELLTHPDDKQVRSFVIPTMPVRRILELWGVRYVLIDSKLDFGDLVMTEAADSFPDMPDFDAPEPTQFNLPLHLYELKDANKGDFSPTSVERFEKAENMVARMQNADFDGRHTVLVTQPLDGDFEPAREARMTVQIGGFDLSAKSDGDALLVLPVQFSHCWQVSKNEDVTLFRANVLQLGVRFQGNLDVKVRQVFGPLWNSSCRLENARDMEVLGVGTLL